MAKPPAKPVTVGSSGARTMVQKVATLNRWREQYNPLRGLTLPRAVGLAEAYFRGDMADLQWTYFFIEQTDPDLLALIELRFGRLLEMEYRVKVTKELADGDKAAAEKQTKFVAELLDRIDNIYEAVEHLGMASFRGFAHCEKWIEGGALTHLEIVDQWNAARDGLRGDWKYNPDGRSTSFATLPPESLMPADRFLFREVRRPINRIALFKFVRANLSEKDWDGFVEIYGIPGGVVIGPPNVPEDRRAEFEAAAKDIAEGGTGFLPNASDWKPNTTARGTSPFKERLDHLSEKLVLAGTGGKLIMLNGPTGLGSGQSQTHDEVFNRIAAGEARRISEVFNRQIVAPALAEAFPGQKALAWFDLAANEETDVGEVITEIKGLKDAGYQVDLDEVKERTGYKVELVAPTPPPNPFGAGAPPAVPAAAGKITNRATDPAAVGRDAIFRANTAAADLAAKRPVYRPIAERLAAIYSATDPAAKKALVEQLRADAGRLHAGVMRQAPDLAKPVEEAMGAALASGMAEHAQEAAKETPKP